LCASAKPNWQTKYEIDLQPEYLRDVHGQRDVSAYSNSLENQIFHHKSEKWAVVFCVLALWEYLDTQNVLTRVFFQAETLTYCLAYPTREARRCCFMQADGSDWNSQS
jgi:hypothetical protein